LFEAAGLDITRFTAADPPAPFAIADARVAWTGPYFDSKGTLVRIEASSLNGAVTSFHVRFPWSAEPQPWEPTVEPMPVISWFSAWVLSLMIVGAWHWRQGRADLGGAARFGGYTFFLVGAAALLDPNGLPADVASLAAATAAALMYMAVEPWTRRLWPHVMITWARVLAGRWRDPVVGRDILVTAACVTANYAVQRSVQLAAVHLGTPPFPPSTPGHFGIVLDNLASVRIMLTNLVVPFIDGLPVGMAIFFFLFVASVILKRKWLAAVATFAFAVGVNPSIFVSWMNMLQWSLEIGLLLFMTLRFGIFSCVLFSCLSMLIDWSIVTSDFSAWYGHSSLGATLIVGALALYGFRMSLGKRPIFGHA
jgi:serine/threonine-protein kinase